MVANEKIRAHLPAACQAKSCVLSIILCLNSAAWAFLWVVSSLDLATASARHHGGRRTENRGRIHR